VFVGGRPRVRLCGGLVGGGWVLWWGVWVVGVVGCGCVSGLGGWLALAVGVWCGPRRIAPHSPVLEAPHGRGVGCWGGGCADHPVWGSFFLVIRRGGEAVSRGSKGGRGRVVGLEWVGGVVRWLGWAGGQGAGGGGWRGWGGRVVWGQFPRFPVSVPLVFMFCGRLCEIRSWKTAQGSFKMVGVVAISHLSFFVASLPLHPRGCGWGECFVFVGSGGVAFLSCFARAVPYSAFCMPFGVLCGGWVGFFFLWWVGVTFLASSFFCFFLAP